jgi:hypothetical protein
MFIGLDSINESLTKSISATEMTLPITNSASILSQLGSNHTWLEITDGVYSESVKVTNVGGTLIMERTNGRSFVAGACVRFKMTSKAVCELIAQGGCTAAASTCTAVTYGTKSVPTAVIGQPWSAIVAFANATSVSIEAKPSWATAVVNGSVAVLTGTPPVGAATEPLIVKSNGCNASMVVVHDSIQICEQVGA